MPKRINHLSEKIFDLENLYVAWHDVCRSRRYHGYILRYRSNLDSNLRHLQLMLVTGAWTPHDYHNFVIHEPKMREISAPDIEDRVVHHALCNYIGPLFNDSFIGSSCACIPGRGMLSASLLVQRYLRRQPEGRTVYYLSMDLRKYFHSIPHDTLKGLVRRKIKDLWVLDLIDVLVDSFEHGLPIGALTSQLFANVVLDSLDHYLCNQCGVKHYARYMDDLIVVSADRDYLEKVFAVTAHYAEDILGIRMHWDKCLIRRAVYYPTIGAEPVDCRLDFCGYGVTRWYLRPRRKIVSAARRRFTKMSDELAVGKITDERLEASVNAFYGYIKHTKWDGYSYQALEASGKRFPDYKKPT